MKSIWLINHYATNTFTDRGGRHYNFAKYLSAKGYNVHIICASTVHNSSKQVPMESAIKADRVDGIKYLFLKVSDYHGNGLKRVRNMIDFGRMLVCKRKEIVQAIGKPDIILASSVHPLTCVAGIRVARKFKVPVISEIRDLWPETIVAMGKLKKNSLITKLLYKGEKYIYTKSDAVIFTMEGGRQYIIDQGWSSRIDLSKIFYINNGVDLQQFWKNQETYQMDDPDLSNPNQKNFVYCGSIREANRLDVLIEAFKEINIISDVKLLIWGDGDHLKDLQEYCKVSAVSNVVFKGRQEKKSIPYIISNAFANIVHNHYIDAYKYGMSQNKLFEYLAAGKPILNTCKYDFNIVSEYKCGISTDFTKDSIKTGIQELLALSEKEYYDYCANSMSTAKLFDFSKLTDKLEEVIHFALVSKKHKNS